MADDLRGFQGLEAISAAALAGAKHGLERDIDFEHGEPIVVVNVAWRDGEGNPLAVGSSPPEQHGHELLADSLRQSADEAEEAI